MGSAAGRKLDADKLDADKLYENAIVSIQLGVEDFKLSQLAEVEGGNPFRALSSVRNLYAGLLLLFKFKIATSVDSEELAYELIHNPPRDVLPHPDGNGGVNWLPEGKFKNTTIDVPKIKERFKNFNINVDWSVVSKLQECRNHLEHLHPDNTLGEVAGFVADLFPVLGNFISEELELVPQTVLGSAWETMLQHAQFYKQQLEVCENSWDDAGVPEGMQEFLLGCNCPECGSKLLMASSQSVEAGETVSDDEEAFKYLCIACGDSGLIYPLLLETFESNFFYWPPDGDEPTYEKCLCCMHETFVINEQTCRWCDAKLDYEECYICGEGLAQDNQDNGGLCGHHNHMLAKAERD